jgi:biotin carboxyl carrier protein
MSLACDLLKQIEMNGKSTKDGQVIALIEHMKMQAFIGSTGSYGEGTQS